MRVFLHTQNDEPVIRKIQGGDVFVERVGREIAQCRPPQVFGVHGEWGAGKTSFLCSVEYFMTGRCRRLTDVETQAADENCKEVRVVWFEAWRYQHEQSPVIALLHEICSQLPLLQKGTREGKKLAYAGFRGLINTLKEITFEPGVAGASLGSATFRNPLNAIMAAGEAWEQQNLAAPLTTEAVRRLLDEALKQLLGWANNKARRVVIIVDDLDRCTPAAAYRLLEAIKIYLNLESCVFLLGINQREVVRAIGDAKNSESGVGPDYRRDSEVRGAEYLEKLCSVIWKLPVPPRSARADLVAALLLPTPAVDVNPLPQELVAEITRLIGDHDCLPGNPRKIKAFCNSVRLLVASRVETVFDAPGVPLAVHIDDAAAIVVAASVYTFHPKLLQYLQAHPGFFAALCLWSRTGAETEALHHVLREMELLQGPAEESSPSAGLGVDRFPDPAYGAVFRIQRLLNAVAVPPDVFYHRLRPYLDLPPI